MKFRTDFQNGTPRPQPGGKSSPLSSAAPTAFHHSTTPPLHHPNSSSLHHSITPLRERGIALVITLILLAVITFMAIAFLVLSSSQRKAVGTSTDQNLAKEGAENALARGMADLMSTIMISTNPFSVNLRVSTNFINDGGFLTKAPARTSVTNVNYYYPNGQIVSGLDAEQNIANLLLSPRAPVFVQTNTAGSNDFRFFLDLNRNRLFEPTGWLLVTNLLGLAVPTYVTGDPQWIGGLEFPDRHHSADNQFIYRYAYIILPASQSLDVNYIYNDATDPSGQMLQDHFLRNQGAGTFEVNLAAFLADLNTNIWYTNSNPYNYQTPLGGGTFNRGTAFEDALSLLRYRYGGNTGTLDNVTAMFGNNGAYALGHDMIDDFSAGPVMTTTWWPADTDLNRINQNDRWAGANNTNHFFTSQDLFDPNKVSAQFAANLQRAGMATNGPPSTVLYNRYTTYRLLSQLGTDTDSPSDLTKINLNYDNKARPNALGIISATNFFPWRPIDFFTNTAIALLANAGFAAGSQINVTNVPLLSIDNQGRTNFQIEIWPINNYTPSVHRLLQFAANLFDSTTNRGATYPYFPTVFRPIFRRTTMGGTNFVFITGYQEVTDTSIIAPGGGNIGGAPWVWLDSGSNTVVSIPVLGTPVSINPRVEPLVSGVPLIVGAKKGFPNFNEFSEQTYVYVSRLLEFRRDVTDGPVKHTNQMYIASITNSFGLEAWNSYSNYYPRQLQVIIRADMNASMTNELGATAPLLNSHWTQATNYFVQPGQWPGWTTLPVNTFSFQLPWGTNYNFMFLTNASYSSLAGRFIPLTHLFDLVNTRDTFPVPHWWLNLNTRLRYILVDTTANRIVDYVDLNNWQPTMDLNSLLGPANPNECSGNPANLTDQGVLFCTNRPGNPLNITLPTYGIINQISLGLWLNTNVTLNSFSTDPYAGLDAESAVDGFRKNLMNWGPAFPKDFSKTFYISNVFYAPLAPNRPIYITTTWQANDPLVHYTVSDLTDLSIPPTNRVGYVSQPLGSLGTPNPRYQPWGGNPFGAASNPTMPAYEVGAKDPFPIAPNIIPRPDMWEFPTNKYANVGWIGRVHRGTPWQTVYLKSRNIAPVVVQYNPATGLLMPTPSLAAWEVWSGNALWVTNFGQISTNICQIYNPIIARTNVNPFIAPDAMFSLPTNDWRILDLFTTTVNQNSERGRLSINQTNLAAWSAVLSGVSVLPDLTPTNLFISPAGAYNFPTGVVAIVNGIINSRTNFPNYYYQRLGDVLAAPQLTVASPFLTGNTNLMNDEVVERIPQQILGLLKGGEQPRYVIYSFGQALKPAPHSVLPNGPFFGLCTNYQITAEVATRAVVRIDNATPVPGRPYNPHAVIENFNVLPPD